MKPTWKILIGIVVLLMIAAGVVASVRYNRRGVVTVQTAPGEGCCFRVTLPRVSEVPAQVG